MEKYTTSDLGLASFLCVKGIGIVEIKKVKGSEKAMLSFENMDMCKKYHIEFYNSECYKVLQEQKRLKGMIISAPKG